MLMNRIEKAAVNNPARRALQRFYEVPALVRLAGGPLPPGSRAVEIGCGSGYGTRMILDRFRAAQVDALDLDAGDGGRVRRDARIPRADQQGAAHRTAVDQIVDLLLRGGALTRHPAPAAPEEYEELTAG